MPVLRALSGGSIDPKVPLSRANLEAKRLAHERASIYSEQLGIARRRFRIAAAVRRIVERLQGTHRLPSTAAFSPTSPATSRT